MSNNGSRILKAFAPHISLTRGVIENRFPSKRTPIRIARLQALGFLRSEKIGEIEIFHLAKSGS